MKHLVIGLGEVGSSLRSVLHCDGHDPEKVISAKEEHYDMLHICIPYGNAFINTVQTYRKRFTPKYTVIHSTVPMGVSKRCGAAHSPVRGKHPEIATSLLVFRKYVGGNDAWAIAAELKKYDIPAMPVKDSDTTEAGKLFDLMQYGVSILLEKEIHAFCKRYGLKFDEVYTEFNNSYNKGYRDMRSPQFIRPVLKHMDGKIGGHCIVENMKHIDSPSAHKIINDNEQL